MPRPCTICHHAHREAIDQALRTPEPYRRIAQRFAASPDAVYRHKQAHLPPPVPQGRAAPTRALLETPAPPVHDGEACARALLAGCTVEVEEEVLRHADRIRCPVEVLLGAIITVWARRAMPPP